MIVLCYHELSEDDSTLWRLRPETFKRHLDIIKSRKDFHPVITFDDGCSGCVAAGEMLVNHGIRGAFYICPGYIDGTSKPYRLMSYISWSDVRDLSKNHLIGAHSMTHCVFDNLPEDLRRQEMVDSKKRIEDEIGKSVDHWATPYGHVDDDLKRLASECGFRSLSTTRFGANKEQDPMSIERWEVHSPCLDDEFIASLNELESMQ